MTESQYQAQLVKKLYRLFPGCFIQKNDPKTTQGIPDLVIFFGKYWAMLEVKISATAKERPNQRYYVDMLSEMSFAAFIFPENEEDVLYELQLALRSVR
jgi:hypothetical protein